uniref:Uncharacterized protein n=1 Tax=Haptolina brevifila TaxID=156173 RepID=A0A7S2JUR8_9EUKA|mmetsp:Transcript_9237/g.18835  ORF Transcript_9237/g.18835 Transcript_9237/m.18835 type:complete len:182 (+) Transcript_9237:115-660(+)
MAKGCGSGLKVRVCHFSVQNVDVFVLEVIRLYAPAEISIFAYLEPFEGPGRRSYLHLGCASRDPDVWGADACSFRLRPRAVYAEQSVSFAEGCDAAHPGSPFSRSCPAKDLVLALLTELTATFIGLTMFFDNDYTSASCDGETPFDGAAWVAFDTDLEEVEHDGFVGLREEITIMWFGDAM